jgi:hypothetical protein
VSVRCWVVLAKLGLELQRSQLDRFLFGARIRSRNNVIDSLPLMACVVNPAETQQGDATFDYSNRTWMYCM